MFNTKILRVALVVFLLTITSVKADLIVSDDITPRYEHTLYDKGVDYSMIIAVAVTSDKNYDFSGHNQILYGHIVKDLVTGETWDFHSIPASEARFTSYKINEPSVLFLMTAGLIGAIATGFRT